MRERIEECVKALVSCLDKRIRAKKTQLRVDPADGNAYPLDSFLECYGEDEGHRRWAAAGQQPAYTGISLCMCILAALRPCRALHAALVV
jgi:hypothetical protein